VHLHGKRSCQAGLPQITRAWLASKDGYEASVLPSGALVGTVEEAMDCACGLYLNDISAWELPRQRSAPPY